MTTKTSYLIGLQALLFIVFLFITFFFNRFSADDFYFIGVLRDSSFQEIYANVYYNWHGRWCSNFLLITLLYLNKTSLFLMLYSFFSTALLYLSINRLFNSINTFYQLEINKKARITYVLIFIMVLFFCTQSSNESWFWYTSSVVYFWSCIAFFFGINIFFTRQKSFLDYLLLVVSFIYIGGSNEPLALFIVFGLCFLIVKKKNVRISSIGLIFLLFSFLINYLSPGTAHRDEITPNLNFLNLILYTGYGSVKFLFFSIYKTFIPALFLGIPFYLLGRKVKIQTNNFQAVKAFIKSFIFIGLSVSLNQLIVSYALGGLSPDRSSMTASIIISIIFICYLFLLGNHHQKKYNKIKYILVLNIIGLIVFNIYYFKIHYNYANAVDERIDFIQKNDTRIIRVKSLPSSGYIYSAEISSDTANFKNQHLKNGLQLKNDVVLETNGQ